MEGTNNALSAQRTELECIRAWRDMYRLEMNCQIVHDSIHDRPGWTEEYVLSLSGQCVGYGSVAVGGPWTGQPTLYEFFVVPTERLRLFYLFLGLVAASGAVAMEIQSDDTLATVMFHAFARDVSSESILFHDKVTTTYAPAGATFRQPTAAEAPDVPAEHLRWHGIVEFDGQAAASGGILFHYNRPFGDICMEVAEPFRRRGLGTFMVQELKRVCYKGGHVPSARCNPRNMASRRTLQKAGFVPCGHILKGTLTA